MRVITPRPVDSPAIGTGSLPRGLFNISMENLNTFKISTRSQATKNTHNCIGNADAYCYVCGEFKLKKNLKKFSKNLQAVYQRCFDCEVSQEEKDWLPSAICSGCKTMLDRHETQGASIKFSRPTIWQEPTSRDDCYFCMTNTVGFNSSSLRKIKYAEVSSVTKASIKSVAVDMEVDEVDGVAEVDEVDEEGIEAKTSETEDEDQEEYLPRKKDTTPQLFNQHDLNDLIRELGLPKDGAELLASRLKERNMLSRGTKVTFYRNREEAFRKYFSEEEDLVYCNDVYGLMNELRKNIYESNDWRLLDP